MSSRSTQLQRRHWLQLALASSASTWLAPSAWAQPKLTKNPFILGVASGSPTVDGIVLWTRLLQPTFFGGSALDKQTITVRWEIAHDEGFKQIVQSGQASALPELAHSVHVEASGLQSDRWYFYRFMLGGVASSASAGGNDWVSPTGRTRTLPAANAAVAKLRLAYASCQRWEHGYYSAYTHMLVDQPDAVVFLGDYIYEYPTAANAVRQPTGGWVLTLDDYRARYALHKSDPELQAMHAHCPWLVTWDDHEVQNDYAGLTPGDSGSAVVDFTARRAAAYQAFYENMPLRASALQAGMAGLATGAEMRIYNSLRFGNLATLHLLDTRQYKNAPVCTKGGALGTSSVNPAQCPEWLDPNRSMLGSAQERWLGESLNRSKADKGWQIIGQSTVFGPRDFRVGPGQLFSNDGWDGYTAARKRLTDTLGAQQAPNVVLLGGDIHANWVGHVLADYAKPASKAVAVEFCGTSITSNASNDKTAERLAENPHFVFADAEFRGYGLADFTPGQLSVSLRVVDDVRSPKAQVKTLAKFAVQAGRSVIEKA
jgi:alkaline phosphatase D